MKNNHKDNSLFTSICELINSSRKNIIRQVNTTMVQTYYEIGRMIIEDEQKGRTNTIYGNSQLKELSRKLSTKVGKGFSVDNLENMRRFYLTYSKSETLSRKFNLSWSHYVFLIRLDEPIRKFYEIKSFKNNWSVRELERQFNSPLYERLILNKDTNKILELSTKGQVIEKPEDIIKDPYIFEFLGIKENESYSENDIETAIINHLKNFILELGKGFSFVERQKRISFSEQHFYIDLVFYNRFMNCFVLFDIKIGKLKHQDLGQLQMYVNYYDREIKTKKENKTIGILLCADKENSVVEMTLPQNNRQLFASKYKLYLPSKSQLVKQIQEFTK